MISILIPIYNYKIESLISRLKKEITSLEFGIEIICCDDFSSDKLNLFLEKEPSVRLLKNKKNLGRTVTRHQLAKEAKYNWLLFLDADVLPEKDSFLEIYVHTIKSKIFDVCFGGLSYKNLTASKSNSLRLRYGLKKESIGSKKRNKKPYKTICSGNLLIKKDVFINVNSNLVGNYYGYDNIFSAALKKLKAEAIHIDNPVHHLGLENNNVFLRKNELALDTLHNSYLKRTLNSSDNQLLKMYLFLKKGRITGCIGLVFKIFEKKIKHNLLGAHPSIFLLSCYKLGYFCFLDKNAGKK